MWIQDMNDNYIWALGRDLIVEQTTEGSPSWDIIARDNPTTAFPGGETWVLFDKFTSGEDARTYLNEIMKALASRSNANPVITRSMVKSPLP